MSQNLIQVGAIFGDPTRCELVTLLMDGRAFTSTELAAMSHIGGPTASHHLGLLLDAGIVQVVPSGRHRYYKITDEEQAALIETLGSLGNHRPETRGPLSQVRSCYNHAAGLLGVKLKQRLQEGDALEECHGRFRLTDSGQNLLTHMNLAQPTENERTGKMCLDWTERRHHIGPPLGTFLLTQFRVQGWIESGDIPRKLVITKHGQTQFEALGISLPVPK